jgi:Tfp pilus assembly protein PilF
MRAHFVTRNLLAVLCALMIPICTARAESDPLSFDPFERLFRQEPQEDLVPDSDKSSEELVADATGLFQQERLLDGRTKLLTALKKDPKNYRAMLMLSGYYMQYVGHFRLALRYTLRAQELFEEKNGSPPYDSLLARSEHMHILYLLSQARLNLDDYDGSLKVLDEYSGHGYFDDWYPGSKSWVLMKLGRLDDAIKVARTAAMAGIEQGRILNMLGILLSMKNERSQSLEVFRQAIAFELSLGREGQPGTPLNNSAEVLEEMFEDGRAETAWLRTLRLPDGCDHVLPALNLALLSIEQQKYKQAEQAIKSFEECNAQFPLRNGEEHRGLVALARGRIALRTGHVDAAIPLLEEAQRARQWFGKIGTAPEDMQAGSLQSLSQALEAKANWLRATPTKTIMERIGNYAEARALKVRGWWLRRRAAKLLAGELRDFEDFEVRFTDSMLEYSTVGDLTAELPPASIRRKIELTKEIDDRAPANAYYYAYLAQSELEYGEHDAAMASIEAGISNLRRDTDLALLSKLQVLQLQSGVATEAEVREITASIFRSNPAWLKNSGIALPVRISGSSSSVIAELKRSGFAEDEGSEISVTVFEDETVQMVDSGAPQGKQITTAKSAAELGVKAFQLES